MYKDPPLIGGAGLASGDGAEDPPPPLLPTVTTDPLPLAPLMSPPVGLGAAFLSWGAPQLRRWAKLKTAIEVHVTVVSRLMQAPTRKQSSVRPD
jgi:hypothetical protein